MSDKVVMSLRWLDAGFRHEAATPPMVAHRGSLLAIDGTASDRQEHACGNPAPPRSPCLPSFLNVGGSTTEANDDIICIIEAMKPFDSTHGSVGGIVEKISVENEASLVAGQILI